MIPDPNCHCEQCEYVRKQQARFTDELDFAAKLQEAFDKAENDTSHQFDGKTCSLMNTNGDYECPICYFRLKTKEYLGLVEKSDTL